MKLVKLIPLLAVAIITESFIASEIQKGKPLHELAKMYDTSTCKACHTKIYEEWEKSIHARSLIGTGRTWATMFELGHQIKLSKDMAERKKWK